MKASIIYIIKISIIVSSFPAWGQNVILDNGAIWKYYDAAQLPVEQSNLIWYHPDYNDEDWKSGPAQLGYGDGDEATVVNDEAITVYFRSKFDISNASQYENLQINLTYDDGAVIYLNGIEIHRENMPDGVITYNSFSSSQSSDNAKSSFSIMNNLRNGNNTIAVEVHQRSAGSSDISFDLELVSFPNGNVRITRGPYLQKSSPQGMTIKWRTNEAVASEVSYGMSLVNIVETIQDPILKVDHELEVTNLLADTKYYYQIGDGENILMAAHANQYFRTNPDSGNSQFVRAWILGDCGTANGDARKVRDAYYAYADTAHTDMILFLGDNAYTDGKDAEYQYALFEDMYEAKLKNTVSWSCLGNHDGHSADSQSQTGPYYDIFSFPKAGESGGLASGTEAYYSFDYGNIHFISLDSYETDRSKSGTMYEWCLADIQNTNADWIVAFWHHPPYSKGSHDSDSESNLREMRSNFVPMLEENGVDLVLSGHSHSYERSYFLSGHYGMSNSFDPDMHTVGDNGYGDGKGDGNGVYAREPDEENRGAVYITAGSSGKLSDGDLNHPAMYYSVKELGSCILEIDGDQLNLKFIRESGEIEDYFTISKKKDNCEIGLPCDDGDICTIDDMVREDCECKGIYTDQDADGYCIGEDANDNSPCIPDRSSENCNHCNIILYDNFEAEPGNWSLMNGVGQRSKDNAFESEFSYEMTSASALNSSIATKQVKLQGSFSIELKFNFLTESFEDDDEIILEYSIDGGQHYALAKKMIFNQDFVNDVWNELKVLMKGIGWSDSTIFKISTSAGNENNVAFLDDIEISDCPINNYIFYALHQKEIVEKQKLLNRTSIKIYPVPSAHVLNIIAEDSVRIKNACLYNLSGNKVYEYSDSGSNNNEIAINTHDFASGMYFLQINSQDGYFIHQWVMIEH